MVFGRISHRHYRINDRLKRSQSAVKNQPGGDISHHKSEPFVLIYHYKVQVFRGSDEKPRLNKKTFQLWEDSPQGYTVRLPLRFKSLS